MEWSLSANRPVAVAVAVGASHCCCVLACPLFINCQLFGVERTLG